MKDKLFLWFVFISSKKMRIVYENTKSKSAQTSFFISMGMLWQVQKATGS